MTGRRSGRILLGSLAGFVATWPMTLAMRRLHAALPAHERYPLPPREIAEVLPRLSASRSSAALLHHFLYGAATGAVFGAAARGRSMTSGAAYGVLVWAGSYLGWIPAAGILRVATRHPLRRNLLMLTVHGIWGACLAVALRELEAAERDSFSRSGAPARGLPDRVAGHR